MEAAKTPGCRGMERYQEIMEWEKLHCFSVSPRKLHGEKEHLLMKEHKLCIAIFKEALKLEDSIGPQEKKLLGRYARAVRQPKKVVQMIQELAGRAYEKEHGHADFSLRVDIEMEILTGKASRQGREAFLSFSGDLLKGAGKEYAFQDWEVRMILEHACHMGNQKEIRELVKEVVLSGGMKEETAKRLAGQAEQCEMREAGFQQMEGMAGHICSRFDWGLGKRELKDAAFLLENGALLRRCKDGTKFYRTDQFTVDGSYIIPHFYMPVFGDKYQIDHFEVADKKRERVLFEMYCGDGNMPKELVQDMKQGRSVLKDLREYEKMMKGISGPERADKGKDSVKRGVSIAEKQGRKRQEAVR